MSFVDAHIHLADPGYTGRVEEVVENAERHNVSCMFSNATDYETSLATISLAKQYPSKVLAAVGVHPSTATKTESAQLEKFAALIDENADWVRAIGEIGLDGKYTQDTQIKTRQKEIFRFFLALAEERNLPAVVHSRQAVTEILHTLAEFKVPRILFHWYDGPIENLHLFKERGYWISIGPAVLYSRRISEIARAADLSLILSETDGPVSYHGLFADELTKPSFVVAVVRKIAEIKGLSLDVVRNQTLSNFQKFTLHSQA
ncbi:MAG: TatD family hydrolase [Candidatus Bathyarchaeia archaeon]